MSNSIGAGATTPLPSLDDPPWPTVPEVAAIEGCDQATVRRWIAAGRVRAYRIGKCFRIDPTWRQPRDEVAALARLSADQEAF
jgi:excisionase family DNA binding protein